MIAMNLQLGTGIDATTTLTGTNVATCRVASFESESRQGMVYLPIRPNLAVVLASDLEKSNPEAPVPLPPRTL